MCAREILFLRTTLGTGLARTGYRCIILFLNVPQQGHNIRHKCTLQRLILALRAAWGTAVRMEPTSHLGHSYNKQPDVDACNIGRGGRRYSGDVKVVCPLSSSGEHGRKGAFVAFGNTESFYRNMVDVCEREAGFP